LQGGKVWLLGGGGALASLAPYNNPNNGQSIFSRTLGELQPGRLMYDFAHWREEITILPGRSAEKFARAVPRQDRATTVRVAAGHRTRYRQHRPDRRNYSILPLALSPKNSIDDPRRPGAWIQHGTGGRKLLPNIYGAEFISQPSYVFEDYDDSENESLYSTLDTLYVARGGSAGRNKPVMTYYHGRECQPFVFSGSTSGTGAVPTASRWWIFVLGSVWGLPRMPLLPCGSSCVRRRRHGEHLRAL
jgi:hypothetical protein